MRILIAAVTAGAGHMQAAAALEEAWRAARPRDTVERLDVLAFTPKLYRKAYADGYVTLAEHAPELYGLLFKRTDNPALLRKLTRVRRTLAKLNAPKFTQHLKRFKPDAVLCTHFMPLEILGRLKAKALEGPAPSTELESSANPQDRKPALRAGDALAPLNGARTACGADIPVCGFWGLSSPQTTRRGPFTVSVVTDFEAHALWMEPAVDLYCVATEETKARLVARGVPAENVAVTGIPVAQKFAGPVDAGEVRRRMGLREDLPTLLVLSGGFGMGPVAGILEELNKLAKPLQMLVVCGRNEALRRKLAVLDHRHPTHLLGFVTNMHELMAVADLVITKPGGLTSSEALAMGKPLFVLNPIPGQEAANSDFLLEHGAAAKANRVEDLPFRLESLLGSPKLAQMARAAKGLGKPCAAKDVCREVLRRFAV